MSNDTNTQTLNSVSKEQRVYELVEELEETKKRKKATVKGYNEEIKRLQAEINDIIDDEEGEDDND